MLTMKLFINSLPLFITSVNCAPLNYPGWLELNSLTNPFENFNFDNGFNSLFSKPLEDINILFDDGIGATNAFSKQFFDSFDISMKRMKEHIDNISQLAKGSSNTDSFVQSASSELVTNPETGKQEIKTHKEVHENGPHTHNAPVNTKVDTLIDANTGEMISSESDNIPSEST